MRQSKGKLYRFLPVVAIASIVLALFPGIGCDLQSTAPNKESVGTVQHSAESRIKDTSSCVVSSGILQVSQNLTLFSKSSEVTYSQNSVLSPTLVSFGICNADTAGTSIAPKVAVFGPVSTLLLLQPMTVKIAVVDAGLSSNTHSGTFFRLYRKNEFSGSWDFILIDRTHGSKVEYEISQHGTYAVLEAGLAIDTTWRTIRLIPPSGGTLNLLSSRLVIPAGALGDSTTISFTINETTPVGLPGATNRVYEFGPDGIVFQMPVTLYVSFEDAGLDGEKIRPLRFYYFDPITNSWDRQETTVDWVNQQFIVTLSHFSRYAFGR